MSKKKSTLEVYEAVISKVDGVEMKGAKNKYTSLNGNMFSFISQEGKLAIRLGKEQREAFLKKHKSAECYQYGTLMKDYVELPKSIAENTRSVTSWFKTSFEHAQTLKPKATTRPKKKSVKKKAASKKVAKKKKVTKKAKKAAKKKTSTRKKHKTTSSKKTKKKSSKK